MLHKVVLQTYFEGGNELVRLFGAFLHLACRVKVIYELGRKCHLVLGLDSEGMVLSIFLDCHLQIFQRVTK